MRDIRKDLRDRISSIRSQQEHLRLRIANLDERAIALESLLEQEELYWRSRQPDLFDLGESPPLKARSELGKFILSALSDGKPHKTEELVALAQSKGVPIRGKYPRRAIHFALVGMKQNNMVEMVKSRVWKIAGEK